jgi:hypothetical protein
LLTTGLNEIVVVDGFVCGGRSHRFGRRSDIPADEILEPVDFHEKY